jgi:adenine-specific DNA-methyltransferase
MPTKPTLTTPDLTQSNISRLAALFPAAVTEALDAENSTPEKPVYKKAVSFDTLRQLLSDDVIDGDEAYEFTWVGKRASIGEANKLYAKPSVPAKRKAAIGKAPKTSILKAIILTR